MQKRQSAEALLCSILSDSDLNRHQIAEILGTSYASITRWERGDLAPNDRMVARIRELAEQIRQGHPLDHFIVDSGHTFASKNARAGRDSVPLLSQLSEHQLLDRPGPPILARLKRGEFWRSPGADLEKVLGKNARPAVTADAPNLDGISAGKNTYTYDAHTYHTKVPPQGIAEIVRHYLPEGGLVLDPFAGSGMTGVAALVSNADAVLNELSPAASFIANRFTSVFDELQLQIAADTLRSSLAELRKQLYTTHCRECGKPTELLYTVWSYRVCCNWCADEFTLWDHCRKYGKTVREHRILQEFPCPKCAMLIRKSVLKRTSTIPVLIGYKCCQTHQIEHSLDSADLDLLSRIESDPPIAQDFCPKTSIPDGVNLSQPKRHGLTSIDKFYTKRNLAALTNIWRSIHRVANTEAAAFLAFVFTSLYQRVSRLSEFRFWGGSGNTANFNVPFIFNEANVFVSFERKLQSILDHLQTTTTRYRGDCIVHTGSATELSFLPDESVDLIFTDPPFGGNINYSEMNILWESWLGEFTDTKHEAIINKFQGKGLEQYEMLMRSSLQEMFRVLRANHWLVLIFMNSNGQVWNALRRAILESGFSLERIDIFDKQHATFKQLVSENTAGFDLILHCRKRNTTKVSVSRSEAQPLEESIKEFLTSRKRPIPSNRYLHVQRADETDYRLLYSEWLAAKMSGEPDLIGFSEFKTMAESILADQVRVSS